MGVVEMLGLEPGEVMVSDRRTRRRWCVEPADFSIAREQVTQRYRSRLTGGRRARS